MPNWDAPRAVADAVAIKLARLRPATTAIVGDRGDPVRHRIEFICLEPGLAWEHTFVTPGSGCDAMVVVDDGAPVATIAAGVSALAKRCGGQVVFAAPEARVASFAPAQLALRPPRSVSLTPDGGGRSWIVAEVAAWRFWPDAEAQREAFVSMLAAAPLPDILTHCERLGRRFPTAHEVYLLAVEALVARGEPMAAEAVLRELTERPEACGATWRRARWVLRNTRSERVFAARVEPEESSPAPRRFGFRRAS